jgi:hypothetical protein
MKKREFIGLKLLEEALSRPSGDCLPDHPVALLIPSNEEHHDACNLPSALAPSVGSSRDHHRAVRRPGK